jgi:hypothetical protein
MSQRTDWRHLRTALKRAVQKSSDRSKDKNHAGHGQPQFLKPSSPIFTATPTYIRSTPQRTEPEAKENQSEESRYEKRLASATEGLETATRGLRDFTLALVLVAVVSAAISYKQWEEIHSGGKDTHDLASAAKDQAAATKSSAAATEVEATSNRAWIFVSYDVPQAPQVIRDSITIKFSIQNVGQTPAVITGITTHLFVSTGPMFFSDAPDPFSRVAEESRESYEMPLVSGKSDFIFGEDISTHPVVSPNSKISAIQATFSFKNRQFGPGSAHGSWFYCQIIYKDIFGTERHTAYYVGLYGAMAEYPKNRDIDEKYNKWD